MARILQNRATSPAEVAGMRQIGGAFSGYARGRFFAIPYGHCSLLPRLRRLVHENLAPLRFSVSLRFYICYKYSRKENHTFPQRTPICKYLCFCRKGEPRNFNNMRAPKYCAARKTLNAAPLARRCALGLPSNSRNFLLSAQKKICELIVSVSYSEYLPPLWRRGR